MECPHCQAPFGAAPFEPRILTKCGHTLCSECILKHFDDPSYISQSTNEISVLCPSCGEQSLAMDPNQFPINQALFDVVLLQSSTGISSSLARDSEPFGSPLKGSEQAIIEQFEVQNCSPSHPQLAEGQDVATAGSSEQIPYCSVHPMKPIEAYCQTDKTLLCINCILSRDHKNHDIVPVDEAAAGFRENLSQSSQQASHLRQEVEQVCSKNKSHQTLLKNQAKDCQAKVNSIFDQLSALVEQRRQETLKEMEGKLEKELKYLGNRLAEGESSIQALDFFSATCNQALSDTDHGLLNQRQYCSELSETSLVEPKPTRLAQIFPRFSQESEFAAFARSLDKHSEAGEAMQVESAQAAPVKKRINNFMSVADAGLPKPSGLPMGKKKRDSSNQRNFLQKQPLFRSTSMKPESQSLSRDIREGPNVASYMQPTSTWAKRTSQVQRDKEEFREKKTEERKMMVNPNQGFGSITGSGQGGSQCEAQLKRLPPKLEKAGSTRAELPKQVRSPNQQKLSDPEVHKRSIKTSSEKQPKPEKQSLRDLKPVRSDSRRFPDLNIRQRSPSARAKLTSSKLSEKQESTTKKPARGSNLETLDKDVHEQKLNDIYQQIMNRSDGPMSARKFVHKRQSSEIESPLEEEKQEAPKTRQRWKVRQPPAEGKPPQVTVLDSTSGTLPPWKGQDNDISKLSLDLSVIHHREKMQQEENLTVEIQQEQPNPEVSQQDRTDSRSEAPLEKPKERRREDHQSLAALKPSTNGPQFYIYSISGYCDGPLASVERLQVQKESATWEGIADLSVQRTKFQAVIVPNSVFHNLFGSHPSNNLVISEQLMILGGKNSDSQRIDSIEVYDHVQNRWLTHPSLKMRKAKSGFAAIYHPQAQALFIFGGNDGSVQNRVEFMDLTTFSWHKKPSMLNRRDELAACLGSDNRVYVIGGYGGQTNSTCLKLVERFDIQKNQWEELSPMNEGRRALAAVALDGIYAIGGYNGKEYIKSVERYDIETDKWTHVCDLSSPKCTISAVPSPDFSKIYVLGGFNGAQLDEVEVIDLEQKRSFLLNERMSQRRFMHASVLTLQ